MAMERMDDRELIIAYINGNEKAFECLLMRHKDKMHRFIYLKVRDHLLAEDIFQEAFIKIINTQTPKNLFHFSVIIPRI